MAAYPRGSSCDAREEHVERQGLQLRRRDDHVERQGPRGANQPPTTNCYNHQPCASPLLLPSLPKKLNQSAKDILGASRSIGNYHDNFDENHDYFMKMMIILMIIMIITKGCVPG